MFPPSSMFCRASRMIQKTDMFILDGKKIAQNILDYLKALPRPEKYLAAVMVGEYPATLRFVERKKKTAEELGVDFRLVKLSSDAAETEIEVKVKKYAQDNSCGGIIVQLPLPVGIDRERVLKLIPLEKDVDALNGGAVISPAAGATDEFVKEARLKLRGLNCVVVGTGPLVGQPIAKWLRQQEANVTVLDKGDDFSPLNTADLIVSGAGQPNLFSAKQFKNGIVVIDFGVNFSDGKLTGDFNPEPLEILNSKPEIKYTPTPGGTGPVLVAKLFENFYLLNR